MGAFPNYLMPDLAARPTTPGRVQAPDKDERRKKNRLRTGMPAVEAIMVRLPPAGLLQLFN
jgi:hypothetical protein